MMKASKLAELTIDELRREEALAQEQIFRLRFQIKTGNAENPSKLGETKRSLARVMTVIRSREMGIDVRHKAADATKVAKPGKSVKKSKSASEAK
jgi:large subunit ribosomal protein L29